MKDGVDALTRFAEEAGVLGIALLVAALAIVAVIVVAKFAMRTLAGTMAAEITPQLKGVSESHKDLATAVREGHRETALELREFGRAIQEDSKRRAEEVNRMIDAMHRRRR